MGTAYLMVRAVLTDEADRPRFDRWYETEHLRDATAAFGAQRSWRCWSRTDHTVHFAFYEFAKLAQVEALQDSEALRTMVAEFDRVWGTRVRRTRDILETAGTLNPRPE